VSCRLRRVWSGDAGLVEVLMQSGPYLEMARSGQREDFGWLARSQGVPAQRIEELWRAVRAIVAAPPRR